MSTTHQDVDATEGHVDPSLWPGEVDFPETSADRMMTALEEQLAEDALEKAYHETELEKASNLEVLAEVKKRGLQI